MRRRPASPDPRRWRPTTPPRPTRSVRRPARLGALAAAWLSLSCAGARSDCPGNDLGGLQLVGTRTSAACAAGGPASGIDGLYPPTVLVGAVFAYSAQGSGAAVCLDRAGAVPFVGTRTAAGGGDLLEVAVDTAGAVLAGCAANCAVTVRQVLGGTLTRDPVSGAPAGFAGTLTETTTTAPSDACLPCTLPCGATWALTGAP